ncbi:hypothetical protein GCM10009552_28960 [Rothia nasimurium]|uniref:Uncharacterized protein n=1 Tax=Luteibacter anthropi TaxID=564369 RepID=A0A7X5UAQ0_9GAMM|nr:hypothetical protein [Luteibacter anthropi]NII06910.1 hypothetical protein [Luteibacter anthropi]
MHGIDRDILVGNAQLLSQMTTPTFADTDWDWFFSSLAQSAAAIVAIFAGFIINKVLANQTAHESSVQEMTQLQTEAQRLGDEAGARRFEWYSRRYNEDALEEAGAHLKNTEETDDDQLTVDGLLADFPMSPFVAPEANRTVMDALLQAHLDARQKARERRNRPMSPATAAVLKRTGMPFGVDAFVEKSVRTLPRIPNMELLRMMRTERERIDEVRRKVDHHIRLIGNCLASSGQSANNRRAMRFWLALVVVLFLAGVIYPLSFLPSPAAPQLSARPTDILGALVSVRGVLLSLVSAAFLAVVGVFARINERTVMPATLVDELTRYMNVRAYAEEFGFADPGD